MEKEKKKCRNVRKKDGVVCVREKGHKGVHVDKGKDIGPGAISGVRSMVYQTW